MTSRLAQMQARFQQKQMHEKEEKLLKLYESQQQKAFDRVSRGSAGSNSTLPVVPAGKVRQMFDERRQKAGVDKSYPLEPLKNPNKKTSSVTTSRTSVKTTSQKSVQQVRNGKTTVAKRQTYQTIYDNHNGQEDFQSRLENEDFLNNQNSLIEMMNKNNLTESLDDEKLPLGFDEVDEASFVGKLSNVGGKLPSQTKGVSPTVKAPSKVIRKATPPIVPPSSKPSSASSGRSSASNSTPTSPIKTSMASKSPIKSSKPTSSRPKPSPGKPSPSATDGLEECKNCSRKFASDRLAVHEKICTKTAKKKRKIYDATKHRVQGTELEQFAPGKSAVKSKNLSKPASNKKDWRTTHQEFISTIRAAKQAQAHVAAGGKLSDLPPPPPSSNPDYIECPSCHRKFNEAAANRHIPKCASYQYNKSPPKPGVRKAPLKK